MFKTSLTSPHRAFSRTELLLSMGAVSLFFSPVSWAQPTPIFNASGKVSGNGEQRVTAYLNNVEIPPKVGAPLQIEQTFDLPVNSVSVSAGGGGDHILGRLTAEIQNGSLRLRLTRAAGDTNPTADVALLVTADAGGFASYGEGSGLKGEATVSIEGLTAHVSATWQDSQSKRKLIRRNVSFDANGIADIEIPFTMSVNAGTSTWAGLFSVGAGAQAALSIDNRKVTISRGGVNEWVDADGVTHGDTIYSHTIQDGIYSERISPNVVGFSAGLVGGWSTALYPLAATSGGYNVTWNWVGADSTAWNSASHTAETGNMVHEEIIFREQKWRTNGQSPKGPTDVTVKYFVRDNVDDAEAEARYKLTVHEPIEIDGSPTKVGTGDVNEPLMTTQNGARLFVAHRRADATTGTITGGGAFSLGTTTVKTWGGAIGGGFTAGFDLKEIFNIGFEVNGQKTWEDSVEYSQSDSPVWPTLEPGESTILYFQITYDWMEGKYRVFEKAGEIRSAESDANPAIKSVPYKLYWPERKAASKSLYFKKFGEEDPEPSQNNAPPIYNIPSHQTS